MLSGFYCPLCARPAEVVGTFLHTEIRQDNEQHSYYTISLECPGDNGCKGHLASQVSIPPEEYIQRALGITLPNVLPAKLCDLFIKLAKTHTICETVATEGQRECTSKEDNAFWNTVKEIASYANEIGWLHKETSS